MVLYHGMLIVTSNFDINVKLAGSSTMRTQITRGWPPITSYQSPAYTCSIKSSLTYFLLLRSSFNAPPSTPPPPGRPQSACPGEGSAPASPGRIRRVRTSSWISDGAHAKDFSMQNIPMTLFK